MNNIKTVKNIVIGAGPAGRLAALELGKLDEEVLLIEKKHIGGTCCNEGCMVVCALTDISRFLRNFKRFEDNGFITGNLNFSYENAVLKLKETQKLLRKINQSENESVNNLIIYGNARIEDINENEITVTIKVNETNEEETYKCEKLLIATGAKSSIPNIKGTDLSMTSSDILDLKDLPNTLNIIGGGIIATELANIFSSFGCNVNMIVRSTPLKELEPEIREYTIKNLLKDINIYENTETLEIKENSVITNKGEFEGKTLLATGRIPNTDLISEYVELNKDGSIKTNEFLQTSNKNIYAAGDCIGNINLTPVARREGICAARNMAGYLNKIENTTIPQSVTLDLDVSFTQKPNIYNETNQLKEEQSNKNISNVTIPGLGGPHAFWRILTGETGLTKVSINNENGKIEKVSSISPSSVDDTAYLAFLMNNEFSKEDFDDFLEVHPSTDAYYKILKLM